VTLWGGEGGSPPPAKGCGRTSGVRLAEHSEPGFAGKHPTRSLRLPLVPFAPPSPFGESGGGSSPSAARALLAEGKSGLASAPQRFAEKWSSGRRPAKGSEGSK
jgi:hypothetical protein